MSRPVHAGIAEDRVAARAEAEEKRPFAGIAISAGGAAAARPSGKGSSCRLYRTARELHLISNSR